MVHNMIAIKSDKEYREWIAELSQRYQKSQIKAASSVNRDMLLFYWSLGRDVAKMKAESRWGSAFIRQLSIDLKSMLPNVKGFSRTNLLYMVNFYKLYPFAEIVPQVGGAISIKNLCNYRGFEIRSIPFFVMALNNSFLNREGFRRIPFLMLIQYCF